MKGHISNIEKDSVENNNFRKIVYTGKNSQLVLMSLLPGEEIGEETHNVDQFIRIEKGRGRAILDGSIYEIEDGFAIVVPAGAAHNVVNNGSEQMKLYTIYSPPEHKDKTIHITKTDAIADTEDHFNGITTE